MIDALIPRDLITLLYVVLASSLGWLGGWLKGRNKDHAEVRKIDAETRQIHTSSDIAPLGITLETFREIQAVIQKAETRREEWHQREEQMRTQIVFWRNKCEELDGELIDAREENDKLKSEVELYDEEIKRMKATLTLRSQNYDNTKHLPVKPTE